MHKADRLVWHTEESCLAAALGSWKLVLDGDDLCHFSRRMWSVHESVRRVSEGVNERERT